MHYVFGQALCFVCFALTHYVCCNASSSRLLFQMQNNPAHINYGFYNGEERPPVQMAGNPPPYYPTVPLYHNVVPAPTIATAPPINTQYIITSGHPIQTTATRKGTKTPSLLFTYFQSLSSLTIREATYLNKKSYQILLFRKIFKPAFGYIFYSFQVLFLLPTINAWMKQRDLSEDHVKLEKNLKTGRMFVWSCLDSVFFFYLI